MNIQRYFVGLMAGSIILVALAACAPAPTPTAGLPTPPSEESVPSTLPPPTPSPFPTATPTATPSPSPTATNTPPPSATATESATATATATATRVPPTETPTPVAFLGTGKWAAEVRRLQVFTTDLGNHSLYQALPYPVIEIRNTQTKELQMYQIVCTLLGSDAKNNLQWVWLEENGTPHYFSSYPTPGLGGYAAPNTGRAHLNGWNGVQAEDLSPGLVISLDLYPADFNNVKSGNGPLVKLNAGVAVNPGWSGFSKLQPVPQPPIN